MSLTKVTISCSWERIGKGGAGYWGRNSCIPVPSKFSYSSRSRAESAGIAGHPSSGVVGPSREVGEAVVLRELTPLLWGVAGAEFILGLKVVVVVVVGW